MRRLLVAVALVLLVTGCARATRGQLVLIGAGITASGVALMSVPAEDNGNGGWGPAAIDAKGPFGLLLVIGGVMTMISGARVAATPSAARQ